MWFTTDKIYLHAGKGLAEQGKTEENLEWKVWPRNAVYKNGLFNNT